MTKDKKKISKSQEIQYQWMQRRIEAGELDTGALQAATYPRVCVEERPKCEHNRIRVTTGDGTPTVVSPVLYSFAYQKAWKNISDEHNNKSS